MLTSGALIGLALARILRLLKQVAPRATLPEMSLAMRDHSFFWFLADFRGKAARLPPPDGRRERALAEYDCHEAFVRSLRSRGFASLSWSLMTCWCS